MAVNLTEVKSKVLGNIAAIQTILERYPVLITTNSLKSISGSTTSFNFMFDILQIVGVDKEKLLEWASQLIVGDGESGVLDTIETVIKTVLKLNLSKLLSCTINPLIPDNLLDSYETLTGQRAEGSGLVIDLPSVDYTGMLKISPTSKVGKYYYFDIDNGEDPETGSVIYKKPNELYKSRDFNAFIWYCINKGLEVPVEEKYKMVWDNRNKLKIHKESPDEQAVFYSALSPDDVKEYNDGHTYKKKRIVQCKFIEGGGPGDPFGNKLKIQLCASEYYRKRKLFSIKSGGEKVPIMMNKTIFEFNNDFIDSLKLFDSKVLMAQIVDKLTGALAINVNYSINEIVTQGKIDNIIKKVIEVDDTNISDCFFTFSNEEYDAMLQNANMKHAGVYKFTGSNDVAAPVNTDELLDSLVGIKSNSTLEEQVTTIKNTFTEVSATLAQDGQVYEYDSLGFGIDIIFKLIHEIAAAIISAIITPKVMILLAVNMHVMGGDIPRSLDDLLRSLGNLIISIIKEIKNIILQELFKFLMDILKPLIELFTTKLVLETIKFYKELLTNLIEACFGGNGPKAQSVLDNVNYADIIPPESVPNTGIC